MIGRLQDLIKESSSILIPNNKGENKETNKKLDIINQIDNEFKDKSEKIKVNIIFIKYLLIFIKYLLIFINL
jgi:hypothetical protein